MVRFALLEKGIVNLDKYMALKNKTANFPFKIDLLTCSAPQGLILGPYFFLLMLILAILVFQNLIKNH